MDSNTLAEALREGRQNDNLKETLGALAEEELTSPQDAQTVVDFLAREQDWLLSGEQSPSRLYAILGLFHQVGSHDAYHVMNEYGLPVLREIHDAWAAIDPWDARRNDDFMFLIKLFAMYANEQDFHRVASAARSSETCDEYLWAPIFANLDPQNPHTELFLESLAQPLPQGFAAVCYLDAANVRAREFNSPHPFNSPDGHALLESYLRDSDPNFNSYAHSAAAALPFQDNPPRGQLLALALDHADERVQLEAAWASARLGSRAGIEFLSRACLDWRQSSIAIEYLTELEELNAIPARAKDPDFMAISEMARWLAHPMEFGRPPDDIALVDSRNLVWPPINEERRFWVVRYQYNNDEPENTGETGLGLVGNITFALFGETTADMSPEDVYALHCCWELEVEEHPLAPAERSITEGRRLLRQAGNLNF